MSAMRFTVGAAMLGLAYAVPIEAPWGGWVPSSGVSASSTVVLPPIGTGSIPPPSGTGSVVLPPIGTGLPPSNANTAGAAIQSGNPFSFPLSDGQYLRSKFHIRTNGQQVSRL